MFFYPFSLLSGEMFVFMFSTFVNDSVFHNVVVDEQQHTVILSFDGFYVLIFRGVMLLLSGKRTKKQLSFFTYFTDLQFFWAQWKSKCSVLCWK